MKKRKIVIEEVGMENCSCIQLFLSFSKYSHKILFKSADVSSRVLLVSSFFPNYFNNVLMN